MGWIIENRGGETFAIQNRIVNPKSFRGAVSPVAWKILEELAKGPEYPKKLAKKLKLSEQKIYYHIRNLGRSGLVKVVREESIHGVTAKYYGIEKPAFSIVLREMEPSHRFSSTASAAKERFMDPFVSNGNMDSIIVIGSPEPHGPTKARSKDEIHAMNIALFLGGLLEKIPNDAIKLDTEIKEKDLKKNMILIGGPGVNSISRIANSKMPIRFKEYQKNHYSSIYSSLSKKDYSGESCGLVVKMKSPFDSSKSILVIAGRRSPGTRTAALALIHNMADLAKGNMHNKKAFAKVFDGLDSDSDGIVDRVEMKE